MPELLTLDQAEALTTDQVHDLYRKYVSRSQVSLIGSFGFGRDLVDHAEGAWIHLRDGRRVLDFTGGVGVLSHGHNHPRILAARRRFQERRRMEVHKNYFSPYVAALGHNLAALLPGDLNISYFPNSGAEAVEGAVKLAYKYHQGRRGTVLHTDIAFHGKLLGAGSLTASPEIHFPYPQIPGTDTFAYDDLGSFLLALDRHTTSAGECDVYAVVLEPFSASSLRECSPEFLREVRRVCTERDIVLVFDEVYTGWGKTGALFHFMHHPGLVPDIVTTSKSFGGGKASISGYIAREPVFRAAYDNLADATLHSTTYYGFGEETATALEAVAIAVEDDFPGRARALEERLSQGLARVAARHPKLVRQVTGRGALHGVFLTPGPQLPDALREKLPTSAARDPQAVSKLLTGAVIAALYRDHGILTFFGSNRLIALIVSPPLVAETDEVDLFVNALDEVLDQGPARLLAGLVKEKVTA
ncbi:aspartate aminotransferase family protein [Streptomyces diastatochromogenes]|uniref:Aminotransferase n=1 Tax=Streptomyces diastatochromogenes TaxID=42236 RepID=A0A233SDG3_STRDA|nr:aminotransferase class III-fold pyridoxal phosphate-dependent enzyme [Streptomyces diastatochromogenes]MCZ0987765.1 aminotransferase class III-fold pyridoxal phosphate-dependent enzyme [Streptomyces diastatochromogenes]OXY93681.1 aminotransferase [Streptomyces diastatochromogenes]